jgi:hypothetical protein
MKPSAAQIRRHYDGSIDVEHYARRAATERREARRMMVAGAVRWLASFLSDTWFRIARV